MEIDTPFKELKNENYNIIIKYGTLEKGYVNINFANGNKYV